MDKRPNRATKTSVLTNFVNTLARLLTLTGCSGWFVPKALSVMDTARRYSGSASLYSP